MDERSGQRAIFEKLEHQLKLSHLINPESLSNLSQQFAGFLGVTFRTFDPDGVALCENGEALRPCAVKRGTDEPKDESSACPACDLDPLALQSGKKLRMLRCSSGISVLATRLECQFETVGHLYVGPFVTEPHEAASNGNGSVASADLKQAIASLPRLNAERAHDVAQLMCTVLEEVVFANYQSYLFSKMHLQLSKDNLGEMTGSNPAEPSFEQTLLDSGEFSSLF